MFWCYGDPEPDGILFAGDSRVVDGEALVQHGIHGAVRLMGPMGQLRDVLVAARQMPMRRLVLGLSPLSVFAKDLADRRAELVIERDPWPTQRWDNWIKRHFLAWRLRMFRPIEVRHWSYAWVDEPREDSSSPWYRYLLRDETRAMRALRLSDFERDLSSLVSGGWNVACIRMPVSAQMRVIEKVAMGPDPFTDLCQRVGVPYLDYFESDFQTSDGSHLTAKEAVRFTEQLISDLERVAPTLLAP